MVMDSEIPLMDLSMGNIPLCFLAVMMMAVTSSGRSYWTVCGSAAQLVSHLISI